MFELPLTYTSWEMATIGHPLSDLSNLLAPFVTAADKNAQNMKGATGSGAANLAFLPGKTDGLPSHQQCIEWYSEVAGWDAKPDITWGAAFATFRNAVIMQGIAARYAMRQASSARAKEYGVMMKPFGQVAWGLVEKCAESKGKSLAKL